MNHRIKFNGKSVGVGEPCSEQEKAIARAVNDRLKHFNACFIAESNGVLVVDGEKSQTIDILTDINPEPYLVFKDAHTPRMVSARFAVEGDGVAVRFANL